MATDARIPSIDTLPAKIYGAMDSAVEPATVLMLGHLAVNLVVLTEILNRSEFRIVGAKTVSDAFAIIARESIDLIIVDFSMPDMSGPDFCRMIKTNRRTQFIPVLIITSVQDIASEVASISSGADDCLLKPLHPGIVRARVRALLRNKSLIDSLEEAESILFALAQSVEQRDPYTGRHCHRLAAYSVTLGRAAGLDKESLRALYRGGFLHDIGKVAVPDSILFKPGELNDREWRVMRMHPLRGVEICAGMKTLTLVLPIIRNHHERWDGSGYPDGLRGRDIPLLARILQVADIYDALTSERAYKRELSHGEAMRVLEEEVRRGWRDPELVSMFRRVIPTAKDAAAAATAHAEICESLASLDAALRGPAPV